MRKSGHPPASGDDKPVIVILAAGKGERFLANGGTTHKLDALLTTPKGSATVLAHVVAAAQASGLPWVVVHTKDTEHTIHEN